MSALNTNHRRMNWLMRFSLARPILVMVILYLAAWVFKIIDTFILRLDEQLGEAILTKGLGLILVVVFIWVSKKGLNEIGFHTQNLGISLLIAVLGFGLLYSIAYSTQLIVLKASGQKAALALSAVDPKTGVSGGLLFGIWLLMTNLVNSAMEEGLFRGLMIRHFLHRLSKWGVILLQAILFSIWHLSWPLRHLIDGQVPINEVIFEAASLLIGTLLSGVVLGYLYYRTDNLWGAFTAHTINNSIFNILFIQTSKGLQSGLDFGLFLAIFLVGYVIQIPLIGLVCNRLKLRQVQAWGK